MIFFLGGNHMIIKKLSVKKLHGLYDYTVRFHDDLTFLYGENGCGKTSILNILSAIITGELYNLSDYRFDTITLSYYDTEKRRTNVLCIEKGDKEYQISLNDQELTETIPVFGIAPDDEESIFSLRQKYMRGYEFPQFLHRSFANLYLPLSRNFHGNLGANRTLLRRRGVFYGDREIIGKNYLNESLSYATDLIKSECLQISARENDIDAEFRKAVLSSALKVSSNYSIKGLLESVADEESLKKIELGRAKYIEMLESIGECDREMQQSIDAFFSKYEALFQKTQRAKQDGSINLTVELLLMKQEFDRIKEIASLAQTIEQKKKRVREPLATFHSTINRFFDYTDGKKSISISGKGALTVEDVRAGRIVPMSQLSSGEKQLLIIFSFLLFGLPSNQHGVYIIDEPEASLHLAWQRIFVEALQQANPALQLIFATHSPEIIGRYSDHAVRLKKKIDPASVPEEEPYDE